MKFRHLPFFIRVIIAGARVVNETDRSQLGHHVIALF